MLLMREEYVDEDRGARYGGSDLYEPYTDDVGRLFRSLRREYGRCQSSVYIDDADGKSTRRIGWVFVKRVQYEDTGTYGRPAEFYNRSVWVTLYDGRDVSPDDGYYHPQPTWKIDGYHVLNGERA